MLALPRIRILAICLAFGLSGCAPSGPATLPPIGDVVCKDFGSGFLALPLGWSGNGSWLSVELLPPNSSVYDAVVVGWPSLESTTIYSESSPLDALAPDNAGTTMYWWGTHGGADGIWSLQGGHSPHLVGMVSPGPRSDITWTPAGIVREAGSDADPAAGGVNRLDWSGRDHELLPLKQRDDIWVDTDGQWIADMEPLNPDGPETFVAYHAGTETRVTPAVKAYLLGMTPSHDAFIYWTQRDANNDVVPPVLHLLPLDGSAEQTVTVHVPFSDGIEGLVFSATGVLAFKEAGVKSHQVCFVRVSFPSVG